ncbi:MAG TPA: two-component system regulatory protein YycI [Paenibacillus sp.]|uniref:two-component system regulatory protein YycI n=1 Tax=Paenibacillus sp. TaxID=58172 RepID=UPI002C0512F2|nr:two-component system regulatory protein YycI [Paenibacillus sp.]HUC93626.1 two-component system regulatory protein YycI [Paenibacillus sp.]
MDWGRAKSVLIIAFLLLNVLLGYQLWTDMSERLNSNVDLTALPQETQLVMQEKGIRLTGSIPSDTPKLADLSFRYTSKPGQDDRITLETPVDSRIVFTERELIEGLGEIVPDLAMYRYDPAASDDGVFVLYRLYEGLPMYDVKLELYYSNQKIVAYKQDRIMLIGDKDSEKQPLLPAATAVDSLILKHLQPGSIIREIRLGYGYQGQAFNTEDIQGTAPTWRVLLEEGPDYYVDAISGEVVSVNEATDTAG